MIIKIPLNMTLAYAYYVNKGYPITTTAEWHFITLPDQFSGIRGERGERGPTGATGEQGMQGVQGVPGAVIVSAAFDGDDLVFTLSDASIVTLVDAKIEFKGEQGIQGIQGVQGEDGVDGVDGDNSPIGSMLIWPAATAPENYLLCQGQAISRSTYSALFALIGSVYGSGDGSTTFNIPNLKGKIPVGLNSVETEFDALAETGGAKTVTLDTTMIPSHNHALYFGTGGTTGGVDLGAGVTPASEVTQSTGGGLAHNNLQPYIVINYIIKVL